MKKIIRLVLCMTIWPAIVSADIATNMQVQRYLNALGYDVGAIDGIVGKNTKAQLINALTDNGYAFDGAVDDEEIKILKVIAKKKRVKLPERMIGVTRKNLEQIMDKKTARLFVENENNIERKDAFEIVDFEGRRAAKITISMRDEGSANDWGRFGTLGHAQRFQIQEKPMSHEMVDGKVYWYKFSVFIPNDTGSPYHTIAPFDLKDRKNRRQRDPAFDFKITNGHVNFSLKRDGEECRKVTNSAGRTSDFCERPGLIANMRSNRAFKDRWLDFVLYLDTRKSSAVTKIWINGELLGVINGDLSPYGRYLGFKFGPYRHHITRAPRDETLYYADIMRRGSCAELGVSNCDLYEGAQASDGVYNARELIRCFKEPEQGKPCPVICRGRECEKLGG